MSQFYNLPNQTTVNNDESNRNNECWVDLLENLAVFIAAASNLIKSLQQTIELSKLQTSEGFDKDFLCACAKLSENIAGLSMKDTGFLNQINTEMVPTANKLMEGEVKKNEENNLVESTEKEDCMCVDSSSESKGAEKSSKLKIQSKSKLGKKQPKEIYAKEKTEKLFKLRENLKTAQKNLVDIQEQVRQLERLYQDYDSFNTSEGQVNPAALYREIMKPNCVPYVTKDNSQVLPKQIGSKTPVCPGGCVSKSLPRSEASYKNQAHCRKLEDKVSILSTVPLDQTFY